MPRGYNSPYTYNIIRPREASVVGSQYTDLDRDFYGEFMDAYRAGKDRYKQERADKQAQALKVSEMLGYVPQELEADILGPVQEVPPTLGEKAVGGLGRLLGIDTELGMQPEQFEIPEGKKISTEYEREIESEERKAQAEQLKHLRGLQNLQYASDLETEQLGEQIGAGYKAPELTFEQRKELKKIGARNRGKPLDAREKLRDDLYYGLKTIEDLGPEDYLLLGKFWASMTPESRAQEALEYAQDIVSAQLKGSVEDYTEAQIGSMVDNYASDFIKKQNTLIKKMRKSRKGRGTTTEGRRSLGNIMGR